MRLIRDNRLPSYPQIDAIPDAVELRVEFSLRTSKVPGRRPLPGKWNLLQEAAIYLQCDDAKDATRVVNSILKGKKPMDSSTEEFVQSVKAELANLSNTALDSAKLEELTAYLVANPEGGRFRSWLDEKSGDRLFQFADFKAGKSLAVALVNALEGVR